MIDPTAAQHREMLDLLKSTHAWIDDLQIAGLEERVIVPAVFLALVERYLRAGGVDATVEWLQRKAEMVKHLGPTMLEEIRKQGR